MKMKLTMALAAVAALQAMPVEARHHDRNHNYYGNRNVNCRESKGTTGTIAGAVGGGLIGNAVGGGTLGTLAGAGGGALLGRHLDRNHDRAQNRRNGC